MSPLALTLVTLFALFFTALGLAYARRRTRSLEDYLIARGSAGVLVTSATLSATVMGAWVLSSPAEVGAGVGLVGLLGYAVGSALPILVFLAVGQRLRRLMPHGHSLTEYVWHRYGPLMHGVTLGVMVFYMFIFLSAELTAISMAVKLASGVPLTLTAWVVGLATLLYTAHGGMRAVVFTDTLQFLAIVPLLLVALGAVLAGMGGPGPALAILRAEHPDLLSLTQRAGIELALVLIIAIVSANLFHQGYWQRVWTARDGGTVLRSFLLASLLVLPIVFLSGAFGMLAVAKGVGEHPSTALFEVVKATAPWAMWVVLLLGIALAQSSVDSLLNGLVSAFTSDLWRARPGTPARLLLRWARWLTVLIALPAILVAMQGFSVLYLFFIADLVSASAVFPVFFGLYHRRFAGWMGGLGVLAGLLVGGLFFPLPDFSRGVLGLQPSLLYAFGGAVLASAGVSLLLAFLADLARLGRPYDLEGLAYRVQTFEG